MILAAAQSGEAIPQAIRQVTACFTSGTTSRPPPRMISGSAT